MNTGLVALVAILVLVGGNQSVQPIVVQVPAQESQTFGEIEGTTNYNNLVLSDDLTVGGNSTFTGAATLGGLLTLNAGTLASNSNPTSTPASMTLQLSDVNGYDTIVVTPTGAASAKTFTFFASSTASTWLPTAGDMQRTCIFNSTTTSGVDLVFAAGTGIDLEVSSTTTALGGLRIGPNSLGCFTFVRQPQLAASFDIVAALQAFEDGD